MAGVEPPDCSGSWEVMNLSLSEIFGENISEDLENLSLPLAKDRCEGAGLSNSLSDIHGRVRHDTGQPRYPPQSSCCVRRAVRSAQTHFCMMDP